MNVTSRICSDRMANQSWNCLAEEQKWSENGQWSAVILHTESVPSRTCPPPRKFLYFLFSEVAFSAFSGKNSAQNLINYIKILTAIINSYQSCSNSNDPLNILHECCDTNLLMISFNYMSTKRGGPDPLDPPPGSAPEPRHIQKQANQFSLSSSSVPTLSSSSPRLISSAFLQLSPRQSLQVVTHFSPFFLQEQMLVPHGFLDTSLHLHRTNLSRVSGAGARSVITGTSIAPPSFHPIVQDSGHCLQIMTICCSLCWWKLLGTE